MSCENVPFTNIKLRGKEIKGYHVLAIDILPVLVLEDQGTIDGLVPQEPTNRLCSKTVRILQQRKKEKELYQEFPQRV